MSASLFFIAIMGCGEAEAPCQQVQLLETQYQSQAACTAATEMALARFTDVDFPVVVAQCVARGSTAKLGSSDVRLPEPAETALYPRP
ncbi:MAG: hypothetical protein H0W74_01885 [Sphingosinicella sp.]|nr:hypothetical protein [Sphingosinicella sp.]